MAKPLTDKVRTNVGGMLIAVIAFTVAAVYLTIALSAGDLIWVTPGFHEQPSRIVIYHQGQRTELWPGHAGFDVMASAVQESLNRGASRPSAIGLSEGSLQDAYQLYDTVEVFFAQPVKLHTWFYTGNPTQMLFPITGRHAESAIAFFGANGKYLSSGPVLKTIQPIRDAWQALGY